MKNTKKNKNYRKNKRKSKKTRRSRKTHKKRGGSTPNTAAEALLSKGIPQEVIEFEVSKFLNPVDKTRLYENYLNIENFKKIFTPVIHYYFEYDEESHNEDTGPYADYLDRYELTNTRFAENTKRRIDACVKDDAMVYLFQKYGEHLIEMDGENIDLKPEIKVNVVLSIREENGQYRGRPPPSDANILINYMSKNSNHNVSLFTNFETSKGDPKRLTNCRKIYAHRLN